MTKSGGQFVLASPALQILGGRVAPVPAVIYAHGGMVLLRRQNESLVVLIEILTAWVQEFHGQ